MRTQREVGGVVFAALRGASPPYAHSVADATRTLQGWTDFCRELDRCRRHGRSFSLILVPMRPDGSARQRGLIRRRAVGRPTVHQPGTARVRRTDAVLVNGRGIFLLLPETDSDQATRCLDRLRTLAPEWPEDDIRLVVFPDDGYTLGKLAHRLEKRRSVAKGVPRLHVDPNVNGKARSVGAGEVIA